MILCTPGLRPWIKGGDIQANVFGSDHCPVHIDLHEEITLEDGTLLKLRDQLNPPNRAPSTAPIYPNAVPRAVPEPPRFATKFFDEFSGKQTTLRGFFSSGPRKSLVEPSPSPIEETPPAVDNVSQTPSSAPRPAIIRTPTPDESLAAPFSIARAAFDSITASTDTPASSASTRRSATIDLTEDESPAQKTVRMPSPLTAAKASKAKAKPAKPSNGQRTLNTFFAKPPSVEKRKSPPKSTPTPPPPRLEINRPTPSEEDALIAHAIAEADAEKASKRAKTNAEAAPVWSNVFAKKLPPLCTVHQKPCKDFREFSIAHRTTLIAVVGKPGPNKGKRFWLCSL